MSVSIRQIHPVFVGEVTGIEPRDMRRTTIAGDAPTATQVEAA